MPLAHAQLDRAINLCHRQVDLPPLLGSPPPPPLFHRVECPLAHRAGSFPRFKHPRFEVPRDEVSDRVAQVRDREGHLGREGVVDEERVVEVRRLEVVQLLRAALGVKKKKKQGLISWFKEKERDIKRTRNAEKYFALWIKSWTLVATSRTRRHAWRVSIVSSMFWPTRRASSSAFFCGRGGGGRCQVLRAYVWTERGRV